MKIQLEVDTSDVADIQQAMGVLRGLLAAQGVSEAAPPKMPTRTEGANSSSVGKAAADLWARLGSNARALVALAATFDGPFTLAALAGLTGDSMTAMKSRWANLGRSLRKTHELFPEVRVFREHENTTEGWSFVMDDAARSAVRSFK